MTLASGTSITIGGVTCQELQGSGKVQLTQQGPQGERNFHCAWDDRFSLSRELKGYVRADTQSPPNYFRVAPAEFPDFGASGGIPMICLTVSISGVSTMTQDASGHPSYGLARVDAIYGPPEGQESDGDTGEDEVVATLEIDHHSEFITYGSYQYYWADDDFFANEKVADPIQRGKLVVVLDRNYSQKGLAAIPHAGIAANIGKVNSVEWNGCAAGTLLFVGATSRKAITAEGRATYDLSYKFKHRPAADWNKFWRPSLQEWDNLELVGADGAASGTNLTVYESADFATFFNAPL